MLTAPVVADQAAEPVKCKGGLELDLLQKLIDPSGWFIDVKDVSRVTSLSRTSIWRKTKDHSFPQPVALGPTKRAWRVGDVQAWLAAQK